MYLLPMPLIMKQEAALHLLRPILNAYNNLDTGPDYVILIVTPVAPIPYLVSPILMEQ